MKSCWKFEHITVNLITFSKLWKDHNSGRGGIHSVPLVLSRVNIIDNLSYTFYVMFLTLLVFSFKVTKMC